MKFKPTVILAIFVFAIGLLLGTSAVQAANVIFDSSDSTKAIGIENLEIIGKLYNVTFTPPSTAAVQVYGSFPGTYDFDTSSEALEAVQTVNDALNINGAQTVGVAGQQGVRFYRVGFASDSSTELKAVIFWEALKGDGELDPWQIPMNPDADSYSLGVRIWAQFTPTTENPPSTADATWIYKYSVPDDNVRFHDVISVSSGGYLGVGAVTDSEAGYSARNAFISRLDQNGQVLWSKNFTFTGPLDDHLRSVVESNDGGFIATGRALLAGTDVSGPSIVSAVLILKVDAGGNLLWHKVLKSFDKSSTYGDRIKATVDGNYVIVGEAIAYNFDEIAEAWVYVSSGALITKIDNNGQVIFSRVYYGDGTHSLDWLFHDVVQDSEGSYYAVGSAAATVYTEDLGWEGMLLAKIDSTGGLVWAKKLDRVIAGSGDKLYDEGWNILLSGNALYVSGVSGYVSTFSSFTLSGTRNWTKQYSRENDYPAFMDLIPSGDGNFFMLRGQSLIKVDPQGDFLWGKGMVETGVYSYMHSLFLEADNGVVAGGRGSSDGYDFAIMAKYDSNGNTCSDNDDVTYTVTEIDMVNTDIPYYNVASRPYTSDGISDFSGPILSVETYCRMPVPLTVVPGIKANGQEGFVYVAQGSPVSITIALDPGDEAGQNADWWVAENGPGGWFYYDVIGGSWSFLPGLSVTYQGPLFNLSSLEVLNTSGLPVGTYIFYFGVDMNMNASLDSDQLYYDSVVVNITQ
jgi:hypothetical protein